MAKDKPTPEEQLLDLIEKEEGFKGLRPKRKKGLFSTFINLTRFSLFLPSLKRILRANLAKLKSSIKEPNLKVLNRVLVGVSIVLIGYLIIDFTLRRPDIKQIYERVSVVRERKFQEPSAREVRPFLYYLAMVQRRNIFSSVELKSVEDSETEVKKILDTMIEELKLVGISWGKEPQAMIEDIKAKKTYFLKSGDVINKLKVDTILKDRVILSYEGEKAELM